MFKKLLVGATISLVLSGSVYASERTVKVEDSQEAVLVEAIKENLKGKINGEVNVVVRQKVSQPELKDFYLVSVNGQEMVVHKDGRLSAIGNLFDLKTFVDLTSEAKNVGMMELSKKEIPKLKENEFITYKANGEKVGTLYVFTDPTCGYCKKLHTEVEFYQNAGIEVKYIPYPRSALQDGQAGYEKTKQAVCADDELTALTEIKAGTDSGKYVRESYDSSCIEKIRIGKELGQKIGFSGTPFLYLSTGEVIPGYQPHESVISRFKR